MSEAINLTAPTAPAEPSPAPVSPVDTPVTITKLELSKMLADAVAAGRADPVPAGTVATAPEKVEEWSENELWHRVLSRIVWFSERDARAAAAAVNKFYPVESEGE